MATPKAPKEPKPQLTLTEAILALVDKHGSQAEAARQCGVNKTYWCRMQSGIKFSPSDATLKLMGLRRNVSYEWIRQPRGKKATGVSA